MLVCKSSSGKHRQTLLDPRPRDGTSAILAQGTSWAAAVMQAFFVSVGSTPNTRKHVFSFHSSLGHCHASIEAGMLKGGAQGCLPRKAAPFNFVPSMPSPWNKISFSTQCGVLLGVMARLDGPLAKATARGFEPLRAEPNGFLVHHLNHSVTLSLEMLWKLLLCATRCPILASDV